MNFFSGIRQIKEEKSYQKSHISLYLNTNGNWWWGYFIYHHEKQQEKEQFFTKQEQRVETFLKYNIPKFKTVTFTKEDVSPMIPYLEGYINNDKKLKFVAHVQPDDHNFEGRMGMTEQLDALFRVDVKTYGEVLKEEENKK